MPVAEGKGRTLEMREEPDDLTFKLGSVIAQRIELDLVNGGWRVGRSLGSEAELMARYGISRATLREALRQVEAHGALKMGRGNSGGLVVADLPHHAAERALAVYLELVGAEAAELFEARAILEPFGARLAAERATPVEAQELKRLAQRLEDPSRPAELALPAYLSLSCRIVECAHNSPLRILTGSLSRFTVETIADEICAPRAKRDFYGSAQAKLAIVEAVVSANATLAERRSQEEIELEAPLLRKYLKRALAKEVDGPRTRLGGAGIRPKLAQLVAMRIAREISTSDLPLGFRLGSEKELILRHNIGRATFREAIRILELHGFVATRRGHDGGLFVGRADAAYTVRTVATFMRASKMSLTHLHEVREAVAVNIVGLAARRIDPSRRALLSEALAQHIASDGAAVVSTARAAQVMLGEICGNRILSMFNKILLDLNIEGRVLPPDILYYVKRNLERVFEAIVERDEVAARSHMSSHLNDVVDWGLGGRTVLGRSLS